MKPYIRPVNLESGTCVNFQKVIVHGQNIWNIRSETKGELSSKAISGLKYAPVPPAVQWRVGVVKVKDLLVMNWNLTEIDCFTENTEEVDTILGTLCSS